MRLWIILLITLFVSGCTGQQSKPFQLKNLAKSDVDMVADLHRLRIEQLARQLTVKLYKRNPRELKKAPDATIDSRLATLFPAQLPLDGDGKPITQRLFAELDNKDSIEAVKLAFDPTFRGDRVFALMAGMTGMVNASYSHKREFFLPDELDQNKLYTSARNLEAIAWQLRTKLDASGKPLIYSNGATAEGIENFSYERVLGKMIAIQDMLADVVSDSSSRTINRVIHGAASITLLPI